LNYSIRVLWAVGAASGLLACSVPVAGPGAGPAVSVSQGGDIRQAEATKGRLTGNVSMRGVGAAAGLEVKVYAAESGPQMPHWTTVTDGAGRFEVSVPAGSYNVLVRKPGSNLAAARFGVQADTVVDIDLVPTGTVTGKVRLMPAGQAIGTDVFVPGTGLSAKAGFDGTFTLADVPVGTYRLVAVRPGFGLVESAAVEVGPSGSRQVPELVLASTRDLRTLTGQVALTGAVRKTAAQELPGCWQVPTTETARSPEGVLVTVFNADGETATASTAVDGSYRIENFPAGLLTYHFEKPGYYDQWWATSVAPFNPYPYGPGQQVFSPNNPLALRDLLIDPVAYPLGLGQTYSLTTGYANPQMGAQRDPSLFTWTTSAPGVVTVDKGLLSAVGTGTAEVSVVDPEDTSRKATVSVTVQPFREDSVTGQLDLTGISNPGDLRLGWEGLTSGNGLVPSASGLVQKEGLCAGDYRLTWQRPSGGASTLLQSYRSALLKVPHGPGADPQATMNLTWDWLPAGVATDAIEVVSGAAFSVSFKPYPGATRYMLDLLDVNGQLLSSVVGTASPLVATAPAFGNFKYRLKMAQGTSEGFSGETAGSPLLVLRAPQFASIEPGTFVMGEAGRTNATQSVTLTRGFFMQKTHVTQALWQALMGNNPSGFRGCAECPVEQVSWFDAIGFANAMSRLKGLPEVYNADGSLKSGSDIYATTGYRLPTEAEWEYAYRAGTTTAWYNGDDESKVEDIAWFGGNSDYLTQPVGQKQPNAFGLFDMSGNVWQWTNDWYDNYPGGALTDPAGPQSGSSRVRRGGSCYNDASATRAAIRGNDSPGDRVSAIGFRLARSRP